MKHNKVANFIVNPALAYYCQYIATPNISAILALRLTVELLVSISVNSDNPLSDVYLAIMKGDIRGIN